MRGIQIIAAYLGVAWLLAGLAATWNGCASSAALEQIANERIATVNESSKAVIDELDAVKREKKEAVQAKVDAAKEKLAQEEAKLERA